MSADNDLKPKDIKRIRKKYGMSQETFAKVLGIGEASIARYETGSKPTRANANLIRAAEDGSFMLGCLERSNHLIPESRIQQLEEIIYAEITFDEGGETMDINRIYSITLQQEVLNEKAAEMLGELYRMRCKAKVDGDEFLVKMYDDLSHHIAAAKHTIIDSEHNSELKLAELRGQLDGLMQFAKFNYAKAA